MRGKLGGTIRVDGTNLIFELHGVYQILSFQRSITVPLSHVVSVSTDKVPWIQALMRAPGTNVPGIVKDGTYYDSDGTLFFEMHHSDKCITVNLDHDVYKKIIFGVDDKEAAATLIRELIHPPS